MTDFICFIVRRILSLRYKVCVKGVDTLTENGSRGILLLPNHPALIDPIILLTFLHPRFEQRSLADKDQVDRPIIRNLAKRFGTIELPSAVQHGAGAVQNIASVLDECAERLKRGENIMIYPAGHILRSRHEDIGGNSGVETILARAPDARVVLVKTNGLWGSAFSRADGSYPSVGRIFKKGLRMLAGNLMFFAPRRVVEITLAEPDDFPRRSGRNTINAYLESFYNKDARPNTYVPYFLWERGGIRILPESERRRMEYDPARVSQAVRELVEKKLADLSGVKDVSPGKRISNDLGLDSLARMDLVIWLENEFGFNVPNPDMFETVADVLMAASGETLANMVSLIKDPPPAWFRKKRARRKIESLPSGQNIADVFLRQAAMNPSLPVLADVNGVRTYRDVITAAMVLRPFIAGIKGRYVGIMLPASATAGIVYLAVLFSGKVPVMINWTVGIRNMTHMKELLGLECVFTAQALTTKLKGQGADFGDMEKIFFNLESIKNRVGLISKLKAKLMSYLSWGLLRDAEIDDTAVVLFTSGSESFPKAVPLTHRNLLANVNDILRIKALEESDSIIGFLPPFHSFGLTFTVILPLLTGIRTFYHPNPTEGGTLAKLIERYRVTILAGTPTFINGILKGAAADDMMSLRFCVTGAERCPEHVYRKLQETCPNMTVLEGYGITECSPVVSVNRPEAPVPFSIGKIMDSVKYLVVDEATGRKCQAGEQGMLMVRGPSIFGGYIGHDGPSPFVKIDGKEYYRTGDLVIEDDQGVLFFKGRLKRFVKLGGEMISMPAIEDILASKFERPGADGPVLAVEAIGEDAPELTLFTVLDIDRETVNTVIREAGLSPIHNIRKIVHLEEIPALGTGKTDYRRLKTL